MVIKLDSWWGYEDIEINEKRGKKGTLGEHMHSIEITQKAYKGANRLTIPVHKLEEVVSELEKMLTKVKEQGYDGKKKPN